ncbi:short-chain dehydrogenase [Polyporus arcularius HHB13444]|uniref:Short-chain dehydrogenase n=1 Tax=Polyporus arcularius HHB13444 TaxID=1314778 RepID=A0A5C3PAQ5_9APHY|nr:short-chain dehydrogenase [Polyporus arcularius HHB13444]
MVASITSNRDFDASTTAEEVATALSSSIAGKTILVTGVTPGGLGGHFVKVVAKHQPKLLILAGRSAVQSAETARELEAAHPGVAVRTLELDLSSQVNVRKAAAEVLSWQEPVDVLVNNAAVMGTPYGKTVDGIESHTGGRVVNVSSAGHRRSDIRWDDVGFQDGKVYHKFRAYGQSKTANILFSVELSQRLGSKGLQAFSLNPGAVATNLSRYVVDGDGAAAKALDKEMGYKQGSDTFQYTWKSLSQGTATHVVAAFDPKLSEHNGSYLQDCQLAPDDELQPFAADKHSATRLWKLSEELVGQRFEY